MKVRVLDHFTSTRLKPLGLRKPGQRETQSDNLYDVNFNMLATVLFTDIVGSTKKTAALGDSRWRKLLDNHHATIRRNLSRFRDQDHR